MTPLYHIDHPAYLWKLVLTDDTEKIGIFVSFAVMAALGRQTNYPMISGHDYAFCPKEKITEFINRTDFTEFPKYILLANRGDIKSLSLIINQ